MFARFPGPVPGPQRVLYTTQGKTNSPAIVCCHDIRITCYDNRCRPRRRHVLVCPCSTLLDFEFNSWHWLYILKNGILHRLQTESMYNIYNIMILRILKNISRCDVTIMLKCARHYYIVGVCWATRFRYFDEQQKQTDNILQYTTFLHDSETVH